MGRLLFAIGTLGLGACSILLGETPGPAGDAAPPLDAAVDAEVEPSCEPVGQVTATLIDDTLLSDGGTSGNQNFNANDTMTISQQFPSVGLLRFSAVVPNGVEIASAALALPHATDADACSDPCGSCSGIARSGDLDVFLASSAWVAGEVTWNDRGVNDPWEAPGARGASDRGRLVGTGTYDANMTATIELDVERVEVSGVVSLLVETKGVDGDSAGTKLVVATRENTCPAVMGSKPELVLDICEL